MNIQGVNQNMLTQGSSKQSNPRLQSLDQQISDLQKRIREVRKNEKLDPKSKEEKIKEYEKQIQLLQQEKAKIQAEERQNKRKEAENEQPSSANQEAKAENNVVDEHVQNAFVRMGGMKEAERDLGVVRAKLEGELRIAESKSYLRDPNPEAAAKARGKIERTDRFIMDKAEGVTEELNKAVKESGYVPKDDPAEKEANYAKDDPAEEEADRERVKRGTGRMEPGQFLDDEA